MSFIVTAIYIVLGLVAGALYFGPVFIRRLFSGKNIPEYEEVEDLGAGLLKCFNYKFQFGGDIGFEDDYLTSPTDGTRLHVVVDNGRCRLKGKRPIVFVHGFPEHWISWLAQMEYFASKGHPIVALNMRGYSNSDKPPGLQSYRMTDCIVEDIRATVKYASVISKQTTDDQAPLLVAHDWGAAISWMYVTQGRTTNEREIDGYVALTLPPGENMEANMNLKQKWASLYMLFFNMPWLPEKYFLSNNASAIGSTFVETMKQKALPAWMINVYRSNCLRKNAMTSQLNYYRSIIQMPPKREEDILGPKNRRRLDLPVLMIRGKCDHALTEVIFRDFNQYLSNASLVAFENCSHWIQHDCPNETNNEIDKFLVKLS